MHINISAGFARYCAAAVLSLFLLGCGGGGGSETRSYSIGGEVSGLAGTLVLRNNDGDDLAIDDNGPFTFATAIADGAGYAVTVHTQPAYQTCVVSNGSGAVGSVNIASISVACSTNTYTVGGTVSGMSGTGLVLQLNGTDDQAITTNGAFTFAAIDDGSTYAVTVKTQPAGPEQSCHVAHGNGSLAGAAVDDIAVTCSPWTKQMGAAGLMSMASASPSTPMAIST